MAVVHVSDRYPWRANEIVTTLILLAVAVGFAALGFGTDTQPIAYAGGGLALFLAVFYVIANIRRKYQRTLQVELDEGNAYANFWLNKENRALWGDKLKRDRNQGYLTQLRTIAFQQVGVYNVFAFALKNGKTLYLPERGIRKPAVQAFMRNLILERLGGKVSYADQTAQREFEQAVGLTTGNRDS